MAAMEAAAASAAKANVAVIADPKPNFGDKQKPLYLIPLKWRKLTGKPKVRFDRIMIPSRESDHFIEGVTVFS